jgi:predicted transcriptional regulator
VLHGKTLHIDANAPAEIAVAVLKALASSPRWRILQYLASGGRSISDVSDALELPPSTAAAHIKVLEEAGLIYSELQAATHGLQKICTRTYDNVNIQLPYAAAVSSYSVEVAMPIGAYSTFEIQPTCGLASPTALIGYLDDPLGFYEPNRIHAGLLWFRSGFIEYVFPNRLPPGAKLRSLQLSMEICSEAPLHNNHWLSDITLWVNGCEVGTWTCPADFGGQRGVLTPAWWDEKDTQYGLLKRWLINSDGTCIDGRALSMLTIHDLGIEQQRVITVRLGIKADALHIGGLNLFGQSFGNYPQDLLLRLEYIPGRRSDV